MGYRSDVRVVIPQDAFDRIVFELSINDMEGKELMSADELDYYKIILYQGKKYAFFGWDEIKWYGTDDIVNWLEEKIFEAIDEDDFGPSEFLRIGEDVDDIEHRGSWHIVGITRTIYDAENYTTVRDVKAESEE